jgi:hypothetical protein
MHSKTGQKIPSSCEKVAVSSLRLLSSLWTSRHRSEKCAATYLTLLTVNNFHLKSVQYTRPRTLSNLTLDHIGCLLCLGSLLNSNLQKQSSLRELLRSKAKKEYWKKPRLMSLHWKRLSVSANTATVNSYPPFSLSLSVLALFRLTHISAAKSSHIYPWSF